MRSAQLLAAIGRRLNQDAGAPRIPSLFFFTDPERTPDPVAAAKRLPRGTAVVYRHFGAEDRVRVARQLAATCVPRGLVLLIAADPALAERVQAAGVHWPEARLRGRGHGGLVTASAHSAQAVWRAASQGVDACVLAPVFATRSGAQNTPLGIFRASQIARAAPLPVIALGGITAKTARRLIGRGFAGLGAVDALVDA
jgi:thiamine-phosphate pyrophosphorylase